MQVIDLSIDIEAIKSVISDNKELGDAVLNKLVEIRNLSQRLKASGTQVTAEQFLELAKLV